ncbi:MAG: hypothetical protein GX433_02465 [Deltaproteobacteria bacterium]|nr:hypothetical protein [Deltaproteobacteria bacterium]
MLIHTSTRIPMSIPMTGRFTLMNTHIPTLMSTCMNTSMSTPMAALPRYMIMSTRGNTGLTIMTIPAMRQNPMFTVINI